MKMSMSSIFFCQDLVFIVACNILVVVYFHVISIERSPFIFVGWSVAVMMRMRIDHYYLGDMLPFVIVISILSFESMSTSKLVLCLAFFAFMNARTFEFTQLAFLGFLVLISTQYESTTFYFPLLFRVAYDVL